MTASQIGAQPHKPCCHVGTREGCLHCAHAATGERAGSGTIQTGVAR